MTRSRNNLFNYSIDTYKMSMGTRSTTRSTQIPQTNNIMDSDKIKNVNKFVGKTGVDLRTILYDKVIKAKEKDTLSCFLQTLFKDKLISFNIVLSIEGNENSRPIVYQELFTRSDLKTMEDIDEIKVIYRENGLSVEYGSVLFGIVCTYLFKEKAILFETLEEPGWRGRNTLLNLQNIYFQDLFRSVAILANPCNRNSNNHKHKTFNTVLEDLLKKHESGRNTNANPRNQQTKHIRHGLRKMYEYLMDYKLFPEKLTDTEFAIYKGIDDLHKKIAIHKKKVQKLFTKEQVDFENARMYTSNSKRSGNSEQSVKSVKSAKSVKSVKSVKSKST